MVTDQWADLVDHLTHTTALPESMARRVVEEVVAFCGEPAEAFIRRRHRELQAARRSSAPSAPSWPPVRWPPPA
jgi:hypothetical protein